MRAGRLTIKKSLKKPPSLTLTSGSHSPYQTTARQIDPGPGPEGGAKPKRSIFLEVGKSQRATRNGTHPVTEPRKVRHKAGYVIVCSTELTTQ